ncbi:MAG: TolC family protein [Candidatus Omnitrophota bacterium]
MKKTVYILTIFIMISFSLSWAQEVSLTLDEAAALALRDNRDILLKAEEAQKAKSKIAEAKAALFPSLTFTGSWTNTMGYYNKDLAQASTQTTLKQYLYTGRKTFNSIQYNEYLAAIAAAILDKTKQEIIQSVKKAFYTLLLAQHYADLNRGILANTKEHLDYLQARFQSGQASESEIFNIKSSLSSIEQAHGVSLSQVESAQELLNNLLYLDKEVRVKPTGDFDYEPKDMAYDEAFLKAMRQRPEIRQYELQEKSAQKLIEIAKADNRPSIYASWDYYSRSHSISSTANTRNWNDHNIIGVTFSWPIFDGWAAKAKVEQAVVDLKEAKLTREKTIQDIALELKNAYLSLQNAINKIKAIEQDIQVYKNNLSEIRQKHQGGIASSLDLQDAGLKYNISLFNKTQAGFDYSIARVNFDKATGG